MLQFFMSEDSTYHKVQVAYNKIRSFFDGSNDISEDNKQPMYTKSLHDLMRRAGYNKNILEELSKGGKFDENLSEKVTGLQLSNKRILLEQKDKDSWRVFQIANAQNISNICFVNFFPKELKKLILKIQKKYKNKDRIINLKSFEEAKTLSECVFVSYGECTLQNTVRAGDVLSDKDYIFLFNGNLSEIPRIEKTIVSNNVIGFSASTSIFDGSRFGFKKIFSPRKESMKSRRTFSEEEIKRSFTAAELNFEHVQSLFDSFDSNKLLSAIKYMPGVNANAKEFEDLSKNIKSIINSMTPKEKRNPLLLNNARIERIARGSGQTVEKTKLFISQIISLTQILKNPAMRKKMFEGTDLSAILGQHLGQKN
jgi:hypothetical protein